jgi:taurine dioxygenase
MQLDHLTPKTGTEVLGLDLATASDAEIGTVKALLAERLVLVFRDQHLTRERHKALGCHFGTGVLHRHALSRDGDPEIVVVKTNAESKYTAGEGWHTDVSCDPNPISASMLYITEIPECGGGDTAFVNMYLGWDTLSAPVQELAARLTAIHDGALPWKEAYGIDPQGMAYNRTEHPLVITHPDTGRKVLWVNRGFTSHLKVVGRLEARHLLEMYFHHIECNPLLQCRVRWQANTLVIWDNVATQHHACWDYFPHARYGERVSTVGVDVGAPRAESRAA